MVHYKKRLAILPSPAVMSLTFFTVYYAPFSSLYVLKLGTFLELVAVNKNPVMNFLIGKFITEVAYIGTDV
jgi:hypothetical protein